MEKKATISLIYIGLLLLLILLVGCISKEEQPLSIPDLFPKKEMTLTFSGGFEGEPYETIVEIVRDDKVQTRKLDGTMMIDVFEVTDKAITRIYRDEGTFEDDADFLTYVSNINEIILQEPLEEGATWKVSEHEEATITGINVEISTPAGKFKTVKVVYDSDSLERVIYYARDIGPIKYVSTLKEYEETRISELIEMKK